MNRNNKINLSKNLNWSKNLIMFNYVKKPKIKINHFSSNVGNLTDKNIKQLDDFINSIILILKKENGFYLRKGNVFFYFFLSSLSTFILELYKDQYLSESEVPIKYVNYILSNPKIQNLKLDFIFINSLNLCNKNKST